MFRAAWGFQYRIRAEGFGFRVFVPPAQLGRIHMISAQLPKGRGSIFLCVTCDVHAFCLASRMITSPFLWLLGKEYRHRWPLGLCVLPHPVHSPPHHHASSMLTSLRSLDPEISPPPLLLLLLLLILLLLLLPLSLSLSLSQTSTC